MSTHGPFASRSHTVDGAGCGEEQRGDEQVSVHPSQGQLCLLDYGQLVSLSLRSGFFKAPSGKMCVFRVNFGLSIRGYHSLVCNISEQPLVLMPGCGHMFLFWVGARKDFRQLYLLSLVVIWSCIRFLFSFQSVHAHLFLGSLSFTSYFKPVG